MKVAIGSKNPVKIESVRLAFEKVFPDKQFEFVGIDVASGVSDQPMSDEESIRGATTRAKKAIKELDADFGVGLEGGIKEIESHWFSNAWLVIINKKGELGIGSTVHMPLPSKFVKLIQSGMELGQANDIFAKKKNTKHAEGFFGFITDNAITRTTGYRDGVISALSRFIKPEVFEV